MPTQPTMTVMHHPVAVANFFIQKGLDTGEEVSPMKLLKLVYIAHGWHLALKGEPLISEGAQAWKFGPVIPDLYHRLKHYGMRPITELESEFVDGELVIPRVTNEADKRFLEAVWRAYSRYSAIELSNLTHQADTPWSEVWDIHGGRVKKGAIIPNDLIRQHYTEKLNANRQARTARAGG